MKIYGNEPTHLTLTKAAQFAYDATDPIEIRETINSYAEEGDSDFYLYDVRGCYECSDQTAEQVNGLLQDIAEDIIDNLMEDHPYTWEDFGSDLPEDWESYLAEINAALRERLNRMDYHLQPGPDPIREIKNEFWVEYWSKH